MLSTRRGIIGALVGLVAAPAIVKVGSVMPVKSSLVPVGHGLRVGDPVRIRLPNDFSVRAGDVVTFGGVQPLEQREFVVTETNNREMTLDEYVASEVAPKLDVLYGTKKLETSHTTLTIDMITKEAVHYWTEEINRFLDYINTEFPAAARIDVLDTPVTPVAVAALGGAVLAKNPVVSRRFFGGVREEGPSAARGPSSSVNPRSTTQETVA